MTWYDANDFIGSKPAAAWSRVPYQNIPAGTTFKLGVIAGHPVGIDRVEFDVDGQTVTVTQPIVNDQTTSSDSRLYFVDGRVSTELLNQGQPDASALEYVLDIDPATIGTVGTYNEFSVVARVYPVVGDHVELDPFFLIADGSVATITYGQDVTVPTSLDGSTTQTVLASEYASVAELAEILDGQTRVNTLIIELPAGTHTWPDGHSWRPWKTYGWIILRPQAGVSRDQCVIQANTSHNPGDGINVCAHGLTITSSGATVKTQNMPNTSEWFPRSSIWMREVVYNGPGTQAFPNVDAGHEIFWTDSEINGAHVAVLNTALARNNVIDNAGEDSFKASPVAYNNAVSSINFSNPVDWHPDVFQRTGYNRNTIVYGMRAYSATGGLGGIQGIGIPRGENLWFSNILADNTYGTGGTSANNFQFNNAEPPENPVGMRFVLIENATFIGGQNRFSTSEAAEGIVFRNSRFVSYGQGESTTPAKPFQALPNGITAGNGVYVLTDDEPAALFEFASTPVGDVTARAFNATRSPIGVETTTLPVLAGSTYLATRRELSLADDATGYVMFYDGGSAAGAALIAVSPKQLAV